MYSLSCIALVAFLMGMAVGFTDGAGKTYGLFIFMLLWLEWDGQTTTAMLWTLEVTLDL
jgi:hypothetical protein